MNMKISWSLVALVAIVLIAIGFGMYNSSSGPSVSAQGNAVLQISPDEINVYVNVLTKNKTLQDAQSENSKILNEVVSNLNSIGISDEDIKYENYYSGEDIEWSNGKYENKGYMVSQSLIVKTSDFKKVSEIVNVVINGNGQVQSVQFDLSNEKEQEAKAEVAELASKDARGKAEAIASGQGMKLGKLLEIKTDDFYAVPYGIYEARADSGLSTGAEEAKLAVQNISPRELEVRSSVSVRYRIK